jgi:hypothetical protein
MPKLIALMVGLFVLTVVQVRAHDQPYAVPFEVGQRIEITLAKPYRTAEGVRVSATWTEVAGRPLMTLAARGQHGTMAQATERGRIHGVLTAVDDTWLTLDLGDKQPLLRIPRSAVVRWETLGLAAQGAEPLPTGQRIRIVSAELGRRTLTGRLFAIDDETLLLKVANRAEPLRLHRSSVERLDVSRGRRGHAGTGAVIGAVGGLPLGVLSIAIATGGEGQAAPGDLAFVGCVAYGAAIGALIGSAVRTERWDHVSLSVAVAPQPHGGRAALSLRF